MIKTIPWKLPRILFVYSLEHRCCLIAVPPYDYAALSSWKSATWIRWKHVNRSILIQTPFKLVKADSCGEPDVKPPGSNHSRVLQSIEFVNKTNQTQSSGPPTRKLNYKIITDFNQSTTGTVHSVSMCCVLIMASTLKIKGTSTSIKRNKSIRTFLIRTHFGNWNWKHASIIYVPNDAKLLEKLLFLILHELTMSQLH